MESFPWWTDKNRVFAEDVEEFVNSELRPKADQMDHNEAMKVQWELSRFVVDNGFHPLAVLVEEEYGVRLVSFPSWNLFEKQSQKYIDSVLDPKISVRLAVEAGVSMGWEKWIGGGGEVISVEKYGASAPGKKLFEEYGLSIKNVYQVAKRLIDKRRN